ncbi:hypothetical protein [Cardinium endosymbiont of Nabis limbatus]|uniref:hypothetical protein n=1 Tax=Cardinium endosymbiont of Nabis limbatus TaxID=3066217 RepID=UPI003AF36517
MLLKKEHRLAFGCWALLKAILNKLSLSLEYFFLAVDRFIRLTDHISSNSQVKVYARLVNKPLKIVVKQLKK